jgi:hypothetical protein
MHFDKMDRRQLLTAAACAGLGPLIPNAAAQQVGQEQKLPFDPHGAGALHAEMLEMISKALGDTAISTQAGMDKIVDLLVDSNVISKADGDRLKGVIGAIFAGGDTMTAKVDKIYEEARNKAGPVTVSIISIARNSIKYAEKNPRQIYIVSQDVLGALGGAVIGVKLGGIAAAIGALAGAVGNSAKAAFDTRK